jgi:C-terminal processing protease CtpA/Prc
LLRAGGQLTSRYFTPSGASIHGKGLMPDLLEAGTGAAPTDIFPGATALSARDADVRLGLETLKNERRLEARTAGQPRLSVP